MIALLFLAVIALIVFAVGSILVTGVLGIAATPTSPSRGEAAARVADAPRVLAAVFNGSPNAAFTRKLWEPITDTMVMDAANRYGYRLVSKTQVLSSFEYRFTK